MALLQHQLRRMGLGKRSLRTKALTWPQFALYKLVSLYSLDRAKERRSVAIIEDTLSSLSERGANMPGPTVVIGFFSSSTGFGALSRNLVANLRSMGKAVYTVDVTNGFKQTQELSWLEERPPSPWPEGGGVLIFCTKPNQTPTVLRYLGIDSVRHKTLIGYWWWELEMLPADWAMIANEFDEVWCSSQFVYAAFARSTSRPRVRYIPPLMELRPFEAGSNGASNKQAFTVLSASNLKSDPMRKNPEGAVKAFREAFGDATDTRLVLKVSEADARPKATEHLVRLVRSMNNVELVTANLPARDFAALIAATDVFLSLHRAEGLGLILIEAMLQRKAVVATCWSGERDFLNHTNAGLVGYTLRPLEPGEFASAPNKARWAEPKIDEAAAWLIRLRQDPTLLHEISENGYETAHRLYASDAARRSFEAAIGPALGTGKRTTF